MDWGFLLFVIYLVQNLGSEPYLVHLSHSAGVCLDYSNCPSGEVLRDLQMSLLALCPESGLLSASLLSLQGLAIEEPLVFVSSDCWALLGFAQAF